MRWLPAIALVLAGLAALGTTVPAGAATRGVSATARSGGGQVAGVHDPCAAPAGKSATCATLTVPRGTGAKTPATADTTPAGFSPANLLSAYNLPTSGDLGHGVETVAVVTAYDDPDAASDLATYRSQYGLAACTAASGCFDKVNQTGGTTYPGTSAGWSAADAQSLDAISAICPNCKLLLVEATSTSLSDLGTAENEAVTLGANFVDNDWFTPESTLGASETTYDSEYFDHPGVAITAPAGNTGYGVQYPAASQYVTAVGGTTLTQNTGVTRGWTETAWSNTGAGCSEYEPKPAWQTDTGCSDRTLNDTAAVADPGTPVAFYDTPTQGGWGQGGGTAISAAIVAGVYALAGTPAPGSYPSSYLYQHPSSLNAITSGSDGTCSPAYLCTAGTGYNGPAGQGTPASAVAFATNGARPAAVVGTNGTTYVFVRGTSGNVEVDSRASGSGTWSGLTSLGGTFPTYPAALAGRGGYIWATGVSGGDLEVNDLPTGSGTWSGWANVGNPGTSLIGTPAIVQDSNGETHIFVRNAAGTLYTTTQASGSTAWSSFSSLGGTWPNDVSADAGSSGNTLKVFAIGKTTNLYCDNLPSGGSWSGWKNLTGSLIGVPAVMIDQAGTGSGTWQVFGRATTGALEEATEASGSTTWSALTSRGGTWQVDAAAYAASGGTDWLYEVGATAGVYYNNLPSSTWSGWIGLGGTFAGVPGATQNSSGNELFVVSASGQLEFASVANGSSTWSSFSNLGGPVAQS